MAFHFEISKETFHKIFDEGFPMAIYGRCFCSRKDQLVPNPSKPDVFKTRIKAFKASLPSLLFVESNSNFRGGGQLSAASPSTETA